MKDSIRKEVECYVKSMKWTPKNYYWKHAFQVRDFALMIQEKIGGDKDVVELSALLHDIGKAKVLAPGHEKISATLTQKLLTKLGIAKAKVSKITECIKYENFDTLESKILRSADSMSLIMDKSGGREWYFNIILKSDNNLIRKEIEKAFSEIEFDFAKEYVNKNYEMLLEKYN